MFYSFRNMNLCGLYVIWVNVVSFVTYNIQQKLSMALTIYLFILFTPGLLLASNQTSYPVATISEHLLANAKAVVREDLTDVVIQGEKDMLIYNKKTISVLNSEGKRFGNVIITYDRSREISGLQIHLYDAEGNKIKRVSESRIDDVSASTGNTIYDDTRAKIYIPRVNEYPFTISYSYTLKTNNTLLIPNWYPINNYNLSVESSSYSYEAPPGFAIQKKEKNIQDHDISMTENGFEAKNIPCFVSEAYGPSATDLFPFVMLSPEKFYYEGLNGSFTNWKEYGKWVYDELLVNKDNLPTRIQREINAIVNPSDDVYTKAKKIYEYVQQNTDYIQIKYGVGGIMPLEAERVHALKYGDCKALTNYTKALLKLVGIESRYTEVYASKNVKKDYESDFASITQGNHIILCIPQDKDTIWVDCTSDELPFGFIGSFSDDRKALVISKEGGKIVSTPKYTYRDNIMKVHSKVKIDKEGSTQTEVKIQSEGLYFFDKISTENMKQNEKKDFMRDYFIDAFSKYDLKNFDTKTSKERVKIEEIINLKSKTHASASDRYIILPTKLMKSAIETPPTYEKRTQDIVVERGFTNEYTTTYSYPKGFKIDSKPPSKIITSPFGTYELKTSFGGLNAIKITTKIKVYQGKYSKKMYTRFRKFIDEINQIERQKIVIKKL